MLIYVKNTDFLTSKVAFTILIKNIQMENRRAHVYRKIFSYSLANN